MRRPLIAAIAALAPLAVLAEGGPNLATGTLASPPGPVRQLVLAQQLYDLGLAQEDAILLLTAIRLAHATGLRPATGWAHEGAGAKPEAPPAPGPGLPRDPLSPEALALALMMAEGDPALADVASDIEAGLGASGSGRDQVSATDMILPAGKADRWRIAFNGQLPAEVALVGAGTLEVLDETGTSICRAEASPRAYCAFTPAHNGFFTVSVTAPATEESRYQLITN